MDEFGLTDALGGKKPDEEPVSGQNAADSSGSAKASAASHAEEWELFLLTLNVGQQARGRRARTPAAGDHAVGARQTALLAGADQAWIVFRGQVDVFAAHLRDGEPVGSRHYLFTASAPDVLLGVDLAGETVGLLASAKLGGELLPVPFARLDALRGKAASRAALAARLDRWVCSLVSATVREIRPKEYTVIVPGASVELETGRALRSEQDVTWVQMETGHAHYLGRVSETVRAGDALLPLCEYNWLVAADACRLTAVSTDDVLAQDDGWATLTGYYRRTLAMIGGDVQAARDRAAWLIRERQANDAARLDTALTHLAAAWDDRALPVFSQVDVSHPLAATCELVGGYLNVAMHMPPLLEDGVPRARALDAIAYASRLRLRSVLLRGEWWRDDNGPLVAFRGEDRRPVALLPTRGTRYMLHDPVRQETLTVDETLAGELHSTAFMFYRPFPNTSLTAFDVLRFGLFGARADLINLLIVGLAGGALGVLTPLVTGIIFETLIPAGEQTQLVLLGAVLGISALAAALFQLVRGIAVLRLTGRTSNAVQAALWDRLLTLPADFFRRYSAGDLAERALGIYTVKQVLSDATLLALLGGLFSWFNLALLFYYDLALALLAVVLVALPALVTVAVAARLLRLDRDVARWQGRLSGIVAQLVSGISKLRVAGAEGRAFALWADAFSEQKRLDYRASRLANGLNTILTLYPVAAAAVIFAAVHQSANLSTGEFLAFYAAFTLFLAAGIQLASAVITTLGVVPVYERLRPILQTQPEVDAQKRDPGELRGALEVTDLSFRYNPDGPLVLDRISFNVRSGEFVALVGASGSGKSTLLRHLLGFEQPDSGTITYDGQVLNELDLRAVRRQIGVVLQHSQVMTGTILDNILGTSQLTVDDAWEAARRAGIDEEIRAMPMGMQTFVSEGGSTFSGGQRQRLLIARALVTRPRIIFFDEATSALDDQSQAQVTESIKNINATRIVIAHRLSTIRDADQILVMQRGRIVETGTYDELQDRQAVFAMLAERELLESTS